MYFDVISKTPTSHNSQLFLFVVVGIYAVAYFTFIRPRMRKNKASRETARNVDVGDKAVTIGGLVGTVIKTENGLVTLRTEAGQELQFITRAIAQRYVEPTVDTDESSSDETSTEGEGDTH